MAELLIQLNANWRVADDPPQWTIEQRIGNPSARDSGWRARKFVRNTDHLLRCVGECATVGGPAAFVNAVMDALKDHDVRNIDMPLLPDRVHKAITERTDVSGIPPVQVG